MPNTFRDQRDRWMSLSEIDYLGQFTKAWLAFNAWYRSAYAETSDRAIINEFKWQSNTVRNKLCPLIESPGEDGEQFRSAIGMFHDRLANHEIHTGKGTDKTLITLTAVYLRDNPPATKTGQSYEHQFSVQRQGNGQVAVEVSRGGTNKLRHQQARYDLADLEGQPDFTDKLTLNLQNYLRQLYRENAPRLVANLLDGDKPPIQCGAFSFKCGREPLFAGVVEAIYLMRCTLFHGELEPTPEASQCYEPAFRIVRRFLQSIS